MPTKKTLPDIERSMGALLRAPWQVLAERVYSALEQSGYPEIRPSHGVIFRYIDNDGSRIVDLAERAGMTKQSMAVLVDYLAQHGFVAITADPHDGRAKRVRLTKRGREVQQAALRLSRQVEREWSMLIGADEMASLRVLLERLYDALDETI